MDKQISYFKKYIETERRQNINWKKSVESSGYTEEGKKIHYDRITKKEDALSIYENLLRESLSLAGVNYNDSDYKWPSIFDRFKEIGDEVGYRTVYVALCSQAHNDAEDILNIIMSRVIENAEEMADKIFIEQYNFSLYMNLMAIKYHVIASAMYLGKFDISTKPLREIHNELMSNIELVIKDLCT